MDESTLRADARRNHDRLLDAARETFAELGVHASVEAIARRAGVGVGTVYRRFPDRSVLAEAVFVERANLDLQLLDDALAGEDPGAAFVDYLTRLFALQRGDRAFVDLLTVNLPTSPALAEVRRTIYARHRRLIRRAQAAGAIRDDLTPEDVIVLLVAHASVVDTFDAAVPAAASRFGALVLQALAPTAAGPLPPSPRSRAVLDALQQKPAVVRRRRRPGEVGSRTGREADR